MDYIIRLTYMDSKDVNIELSEVEVPKFLENIQKNLPYWAPNNATAFWTPSEQLRFVSIAKKAIDEKPAEKPVEKEKIVDINETPKGETK